MAIIGPYCNYKAMMAIIRPYCNYKAVMAIIRLSRVYNIHYKQTLHDIHGYIYDVNPVKECEFPGAGCYPCDNNN